MSFICIRGRFHIAGYQPDGDSVKFAADNPDLFKRLKTDKGGQGYVKLNNKGFSQLRIEGIDALETHYIAGGGHHQPWQEATAAREYLLALLGFKGVEWGEKETEVTGVEQDGLEGFILTKKVDNNRYGRPVSFIYSGKTDLLDGSVVFLDAALVRKSLNYKMLEAGQAYPTYYTTLYTDMRNELSKAVIAARTANKGLWVSDVTGKGFEINSIMDLEEHLVILPKLYRRLMEHLAKDGGGMDGFATFLDAKNDELVTLTNVHRMELKDLLEIDGSYIKLKEMPENIIFIPQM